MPGELLAPALRDIGMDVWRGYRYEDVRRLADSARQA
jgi:hypothetical protein